MKKFFSLIFAALFAVSMMGSTSTLNFTAKCGGSGTADDGAVWTVTSDGAESNFDSDRGIHYGTKSASVTYLQLETSDIDGTITSVVVNASDAQACATASVTVGETSFISDVTTVENNTPGNDYIFNGKAEGTIVVRIDRGTSMTKALYVKSIVVTYDKGEVKQDTFAVSYKNLSTGEELATDSVIDGDTIVLPITAPKEECDIDGWKFIGWTAKKSNIALVDIISGEFVPTQDTVLNAVFRHEAGADSVYALVDSDLTDWEGEYLIVYETEEVAFNGGLEALDVTSNGIDVNIIDNKIEANATTNAAKVTIAEVDGGYSLQAANGNYFGVTSYSNGLKEGNSVYKHDTPSIDDSGNAILAISNSSWASDMILNFNADSGQKRFRYYKGGNQKQIQLYKKSGVVGYDYNVNPECEVTPTALDETKDNVKAIKTFENGNIYIHHGDKVYTIYGNRVK